MKNSLKGTKKFKSGLFIKKLRFNIIYIMRNTVKFVGARLTPIPILCSHKIAFSPPLILFTPSLVIMVPQLVHSPATCALRSREKIMSFMLF